MNIQVKYLSKIFIVFQADDAILCSWHDLVKASGKEKNRRINNLINMFLEKEVRKLFSIEKNSFNYIRKYWQKHQFWKLTKGEKSILLIQAK